MPRYLATHSKVVSIDAPSASAARATAEGIFGPGLVKEDLPSNVRFGNIMDAGIKIEKDD